MILKVRRGCVAFDEEALDLDDLRFAIGGALLRLKPGRLSRQQCHLVGQRPLHPLLPGHLVIEPGNLDVSIGEQRCIALASKPG